MTTIPCLSRRLNWLLTERADELGRETGFVQRGSKMTGAKFSQTTVLGWLTKPEASLSELSQTAACVGVKITPQGLDDRFSPASAELLKRLFMEAVTEVVDSEPVAIPILQRFAGVNLLDSSTILLPDELMEHWPGCGPSSGKASLKVVVDWDWLSGGMQLRVTPGRHHDQHNDLAARVPPAGHVRITDLGFFNLSHFQAMTEAGAYWLSRLKAKTTLRLDPYQPATSISRVLGMTNTDEFEMAVWLGGQARVACRLFARRLPHTVAEERLRKLYQAAKREGRTPSADQIALTRWHVLVTNIPSDLLSLNEAFGLYRVRWQIELLFKLWKTHALLDVSRSSHPWRILTELFAKLLAVIIQHWLILVGCWASPNRSLTKAAQTIRHFAFAFALGLLHRRLLFIALSGVQFALASSCQLNSRRAFPNTFQHLLALA